MSVYVSSNELTTLMQELGKEIDTMEAMLTDIDNKTKDITPIWAGDDSEKYTESLNELKNVFDNINESNKEYTTYLKKVINSYSKFDNDYSNVIDNGDKAFDININ